MNYSDEEKEAIEYFKKDLEMTKEMGKRWGFQEEIRNNEILLNLIQKQSMLIDKMAIYIRETDKDEDICKKIKCDESKRNCKECIIEFFKKEVEKEC